MKLVYTFYLICVLFVCCSRKLNPAYYAGYIYSTKHLPIKGLRICMEWDNKQTAYTDNDGYFKLSKTASSISNLFIYKDSILIDSIQVIRNSGGEKVNFYFIEGRSDTAFIKGE